jgi:hypothetical protein
MGLNVEEISARVGVNEKRIRAILEAYDRVPKYLKNKVVLDTRGANKREDQITLKNANAVVNAAKNYSLPASVQEKLFEYAKQPGVTKPQIRQAGRLMASGASFKDATKYLGSVRVISVNFMMTEAAIKEVERDTQMKAKDAIYQFVAKSGEFPLARISSQVYKPRTITRKKEE